MNDTAKAFKAMGSNAVPFLIATLERKPTEQGEAVDEKMYKDGLAQHVPKDVVEALPSAMRTEERREFAAFLVEQIGPDAAASIPTLMAILTDQSEGWRIEAEVRTALLAMGEKLADQTPQLIAFLKGDDRGTREFGATLLANAGPKAKAAVPTLLKLVNTQDWSLSLSVARALWNIARQTNVVLNVYTNCLQSTNSTCRQLALGHLREMGTAAREAGPQVKAMVTDSDDLVRRQAEKALREIDADLLQTGQQELTRDSSAQVAKLVQSLHSSNFQERFRALETIWVFGPDAKPAVTALIEVLTGPAPPLPGQFSHIGLMNSRRNAAVALGEIGPESRASVPALIGALNEHMGYDAVYCRALGCIGPDAKDAVATLEATMQNMQNDNRGIRLAAATALTKIAPQQSADAVAVLRALRNAPKLAIHDPADRFFTLAASVPLWRLGLEKEPPVPGIVEELNRNLGGDKISYVEILGDIGPDAKPALPTLEKFLEPNQFIRLRQAATIAIRKIDPSEAARLGLPGNLGVP